MKLTVRVARHDVNVERMKHGPVGGNDRSVNRLLLIGSSRSYGSLLLDRVSRHRRRLVCRLCAYLGRSRRDWDVRVDDGRAGAKPEIAILNEDCGQRSQQQHESEQESVRLLAPRGDLGLGVGGSSWA